MHPFYATHLTCCGIAVRPHEAGLAVVEGRHRYPVAGVSTKVIPHCAPQRLGLGSILGKGRASARAACSSTCVAPTRCTSLSTGDDISAQCTQPEVWPTNPYGSQQLQSAVGQCQKRAARNQQPRW